jgi:hypothetical protein
MGSWGADSRYSNWLLLMCLFSRSRKRRHVGDDLGWSLNLRGPLIGYGRLSNGRGDLPVDGEFTCSWPVSRDSS